MARDIRRDVAVLRLDRKVPGLMPVPVAPQIGTPVIALGAPLGAWVYRDPRHCGG